MSAPLVSSDVQEAAQAAAESGEYGCGWFALCDRVATVALPHPVLGAVLACERCARRAGRDAL